MINAKGDFNFVGRIIRQSMFDLETILSQRVDYSPLGPISQKPYIFKTQIW